MSNQVLLTTNMKCQSCLSKVGPLLDADEHITSWTVDLEDSRKLVTAVTDESDYAANVIGLVNKAGFEASVLDQPVEATRTHTNGGHETDSTAKGTFQLSTYKPLFLVVCYVIGGALFAESFFDEFVWSRAMTWFMGFFFVGFAFFKLLDISKFADAFATYDIVGKRIRAYGLAYPWIELGLGVLFLSQRYLTAANIITVIVMSVGLIGVIAAVRKKQTIQCACLGTVFNLPMSVVTIIENSVMIAMAVSMLII